LMPLALLVALLAFSGKSAAQTVFLNFNTPGQYTSNFNPWNDNGSGTNGLNYSFQENTTNGVGGSGGVSVFANNDTTAAYRGGWNFATNGATMVVSVLVYADGQTSANRLQLGIMNSATNGLNSNAGVAFETYRLAPASATSWQLFEQFRARGATTNGPLLGLHQHLGRVG
jgi:hypothetical protein